MNLIRRFASLNLTVKLVTVVLLILVTVVAVNYTIFMHGYVGAEQRAMVKSAAAFTAVADAAKDHAASLLNQHVYKYDEMLAELQASQKKDPSYDYTKSRLFGTIPVVAGWTAARLAAKKENIDFKIAAFQARNPKNDPNNDTDDNERAFRTKLLRDLVTQVESESGESAYRINKKTNTLHYLRAIRLDATCMLCHGKPGDPKLDPDGDGKDPLGFPMENWHVGQMHGAFEVILPLDEMDAQVASFFKRGVGFTLPLVIFATIAFVLFLRSLLSKPLTMLMGAVHRVAERDLTARIEIDRKDEIGKLAGSFNTLRDNLHLVVSDVRQATSDVASASTEIAASNEEMATGMQEQQRQTATVSSAMEEMAASVGEVAGKAKNAAQMAADSGDQANEGGSVVGQTVEGMRAISHQVNESATAVAALGKRGEQIGDVIAVINDIADQTNLLALNAAIEAARAGEHGRGFAVVADEVRKLAERTTQATEEVAESIKAIQDETTRAVERMEDGTQRVNAGVELADKAGEALGRIVEGSKGVSEMIQSIAAAAEQQNSASAEISRNVESINAVTNESAQGVQQAAQAAGQLSEKAEQLQALVGKFKLSDKK